jgi:hypothetical protein
VAFDARVTALVTDLVEPARPKAYDELGIPSTSVWA